MIAILRLAIAVDAISLWPKVPSSNVKANLINVNRSNFVFITIGHLAEYVDYVCYFQG